MRNIFILLIRFKDGLFFFFLAFISLWLVVNFNHLNRVNWLHTSNSVSGNIHEKTSSVESYFGLTGENALLADANARLLEESIQLKKHKQELSDSIFILQSLLKKDTTLVYDSLDNKIKTELSLTDTNIKFIPCQIVYNNTNNNKNYLTIDKGLNQGIAPGDGIVTERGIVGKVISVSANFSLVKSILHFENKISSKLEKINELGSAVWENKELNILTLKEVPRHATINIGDTVVTSEYNSVYPQEHPIGKIILVELDEHAPFYKLKVELFENLNKIRNAYIYKNLTNIEKVALIQQKDTLP